MQYFSVMRKTTKAIITRDLPQILSGKTLPLPTLQSRTIVQQETGTETWTLRIITAINTTGAITAQQIETAGILAEALLIPPGITGT